MREKYSSRTPLTLALDQDIDPGILLARAARDAAIAEVLADYEAHLAQSFKIPGVAPVEPLGEIDEIPEGRPDLNDYLRTL